MAQSSQLDSTETKVQVWVRMKPLNILDEKKTLQVEKNSDDENSRGEVLIFKSEKMFNMDSCKVISKFTFDRVIPETSSQSMVYDYRLENLVAKVFNGTNVCIFAFGPTGCGKTFSMQGEKDSENTGIIPRAVQQILQIAYTSEDERAVAGVSQSTEVSASFLEIYNEKLIDLLEPLKLDDASAPQQLEIRENTCGRVIIKGLTHVPVKSFPEFWSHYEKGCLKRKQGPTKMNSHSSRSHSILTLKVRHQTLDNKIAYGKLHLIDLAGNEDNRKTGNAGQQLVESGNINLSLFALGKVISSLNVKASAPQGMQERIPYRDSKLTRILKDSLGGNSVGLMLCCVSGHPGMSSETAQALNYAAKAKNIRNTVKDSVFVIPAPAPEKQEKENIPRAKNFKRNTTEEMAARLNDWKAKRLKMGVPMTKGQTKLGLSARPKDTINRAETFESDQDACKDEIKQSIESEFTPCAPLPDATLSAALLPECHISSALTNREPPDDICRNASADECAENAKNLIIKAKELESLGSLQEALETYKLALHWLPGHGKLLKRIHALEQTVTRKAIEEMRVLQEIDQNSSLPSSLLSVSEIQFQGQKMEEDSLTQIPKESFRSIECSKEMDGLSILEQETSVVEINSQIKTVLEHQLLQHFNFGNKEALQCLHGIGKKRAEQIIEARRVSPFSSLHDLSKIGLTAKQISKIANSNTVNVLIKF